MGCRQQIKQQRTDEEWVRDLSQPGTNQIAAFTELGCFLRYHLLNDIRRRAPTLAPLMSLTTGELEAFADDIVQISLERIYTKLDQFSPTAAFPNYALTISRRLLIDVLRKKYWSVEAPASFEQPAMEDLPSTTAVPSLDVIPDPHSELESNLPWREMVQIVYDAIREDLSPNQATVFIAYFFQNLSSKEIAVQMGKSFVEVDQLRYQARKKIKARLKEKGYDEADF